MTPAVNGKPLRFMLLVMTAWIAMRLVSQPGSLPPPVRLIASSQATPLAPAAAPAPAPRPAPSAQPVPLAHATPVMAMLHHNFLPATPAPKSHPETTPIDLMDFVAFSVAFANRRHTSEAPPAGHGLFAQPAPLLLPSASRPDRWRGSAWMLWRGGSPATDIANVGRLGGSQAGLRIDHELTPTAPVRTTAYARTTTALQRPTAPEAAIGLAIQPVRAIPVNLAVERRIALGTGARNANAVMAVGGFGPTPVGRSLMAEAYAQTGMVGFHRRDAFIDGKLSLLSSIDGSPIKVGAALSGGAQPGVERVDVGPEVQMRLPLPMVAARIGLEWRERIGGRAAPASGLALTLAADF